MRHDFQVELRCTGEPFEAIGVGELDVSAVVVQQHVDFSVAIDAPHGERVDTAWSTGGQAGAEPSLARLLGHDELQRFRLLGGADPGLAAFDERIEVLSVSGSGPAFEIDVRRTIFTGLGIDGDPEIVGHGCRSAGGDEQQCGDQFGEATACHRESRVTGEIRLNYAVMS